jgi:hypothetical protein
VRPHAQGNQQLVDTRLGHTAVKGLALDGGDTAFEGGLELVVVMWGLEQVQQVNSVKCCDFAGSSSIGNMNARANNNSGESAT